MRVLMLECAHAGQKHAGGSKRIRHSAICVALLTLIGDDALAREARRIRGEGAVLVDGVGDVRGDVARLQRPSRRRPDVEVFAAVTRRRVHEPGAGVVGDVIAVEKWDGE